MWKSTSGSALGGSVAPTAQPSLTAEILIRENGSIKSINPAALAYLLSGRERLDEVTYSEYATAILAGAGGGKRTAGANALIAAFGTAQKLTVVREGAEVMTFNFTGAMVSANDGVELWVAPSTFTTLSIANANDLGNEAWTFVFSGGTAFARTMSGSVGPTNSIADLRLSSGTTGLTGLIAPTLKFILPRELDNV